LRQNPDPINLLSVHIYPKSLKLSPYGAETVEQFIGRYAKFAAKSGKPLFMGEFPVQSREQTNEYIRAIKKNRVPLAAFWNFNDVQQEKPNSVSFGNQRSFVLDLVVSANRQLQEPP
jgi:hypothetical protein